MASDLSAKIKQRCVIEFLYISGETNATAIHEHLFKVYKTETIDVSNIRRWIARFKNNDFYILDKPRSGRPSTSVHDSNMQLVVQLIEDNRRIKVKEMSETIGISVGSILSILDKLSYRKIVSRWVPKLLTNEMKKQRLEICAHLLSEYGSREYPFKGVITGDETWIYRYDPETNQESKEWRRPNSPFKNKQRTLRTKDKIMATFFWDQEGIILIDFMERNETINKERYCQTLTKLRRAFKDKRKHLNGHQVTIHHDNARPHSAHMTTDMIASFHWNLMPQPAYSPDLAPSDFYLFSHLKRHLRGLTFESDDAMKKAVKLWSKCQVRQFYESAFISWKERWQRCIAEEGGYLE